MPNFILTYITHSMSLQIPHHRASSFALHIKRKTFRIFENQTTHTCHTQASKALDSHFAKFYRGAFEMAESTATRLCVIRMIATFSPSISSSLTLCYGHHNAQHLCVSWACVIYKRWTSLEL